MVRTITVYTTDYCPYCRTAKQLLDARGLAYTEINLSTDDALRQKISAKAGGYRTVPMIFIGDEFMGGYDQLSALDQAGELLKKVNT